MPWLFAIPEFVKKRACRYLLQHYLGQYLEEKIQLEDLTVDLYNGTGTINNVPLNVEAINDTLEGTGSPVQVVSGYLGRVTISVPWSALMSDSCKVEVAGLTLSVMPCFSSSLGEDLTTMTDSLFFGSMSNSMQMAEEVMRGGPVDGEGDGRSGEGVEEEGRTAFEGMEALARAIETVLSQVQIELTDTVVQLVCRSQDYTHQYFVRVKVQSTKFYDELRGRSVGEGSKGEESSVDRPSINDNEEETMIRQTAVETKILELSNISVEVGGVGEDIHTSTLSPEELPGVPVACVSGVVNVSVKVRGVEASVVPRVQVEAVVGGVHCLLAPAQLHILTEVATNLQRGKGSKSTTFEQASTGINRPIPTKQLYGMDSQLRQHYNEERKRREHQGDLLRADPYQNSFSRGQSGRGLSGMRDSTVLNSPDMFYSLNLHDSYSETSTRSEFGGDRSMESSLCTTATAASSTTMGDSYISMRTHGVSPDSGGYDHYIDDVGSDNMDSIPLGGGSGLQQLVVSSGGGGSKSSTRDGGGLHTTRPGVGVRGGGRREGISQQDVCKYSFTLSGVTVAILQADPAYVHTTDKPSNTHHSWNTDTTKPSQQYPSSLDSSGLDPICYLLEVAEVLKCGGVNRKEIKRQQAHLAQALPLDHLFLWLSTVKTGVSMQGDNVDLQLTIASTELWEFLYSNTANLPHITTPVSAALLVELCEDIPLSQPCIRLTVSSSMEQSTKKRYKQTCSEHIMSVNLSLTSPHFNLDPTLIERLQPLLHSFSLSSVSPRGGVGGGGRSGAVSQSQLKHSLYMTTSNFHTISLQRQAVFNQAVSSSDNHNKSEQRIHIKITTSSASLSFRFPVPELSESQRRLPWYHPSLRQEVLHVTLSHITLTSTLLPHLPHTASVYDTHFTHADVYLSCDGSVEGRELFLTIGKRASVEQSSPYGPGATSDGSRANVQLMIQPVSENVLEQLNKLSSPSHPPTHAPSHPHIFDDLGLGGMGTEDEGKGVVYEPSPFSTKKDMYSGKGGSQVHEEDNTTPQEHTEHLITPGNRSEMEEFERYSSSLSQYHLSLHLPIICLHLPSKKFLETLYSRFATDLSLWRPATSEQVERTNAAKSLFFSSVDIQPAATSEEKVQMFKSVLKENEEEDDEDIAHEFLPSPPPSSSSTSFPLSSMGLSQLALSVSIDTAHVSMLLHVREDKESESSSRGSHSSNYGTNDSPRDSLYSSALSEPLLLDIDSAEGGGGGERGNKGRTTGENGGKQHEIDRGLAVVELSTLHFYLVSGYRGDCNHDYVCAYVDQFSLFHTGSLHSSGVPLYSAVINSASQDTHSKLHCIVQTTPERLRVRSTLSGNTPSPPMILVAMDIRLEPERNSKTNKCAVALQNTLINHRITPPQLSCFTQFGDFLSLSEETVEGYESPSLITEMHLHLQEFRVEYCPLHLPLSALLGVSSVQLSTSLVAGSPLVVVRILVDHTHLAFAADTHQQHLPTLKNDYVCVLDLDWFELTLRLCNTAQFEEESHKLFSHLPEVSLECSSNVLQIHTCMDSFIALRDLLVYLASDGDLRPKPRVTTRGGYSSPQSSLGGSQSGSTGIDTIFLATSPPTTSLKPSSSTTTSTDIDDLISDAMEDSQTTIHTLTPSSSDHSINGDHRMSSAVDEGSGVGKSSSKMQVVEHGERSLDIDFGDSDDEGERQNEGRISRSGLDDNMTSSGADVVADLMAASQEIDDDVINGRGLRREGAGGGERKGRGELDEDGFCVLDAPTTTYVAPGSKPVVKCLLPEGDTWRIVENHFAIPEHHVDQLQRPKHFPEPILQYTLKELTIVWHLYGGHDFSPPLTSPAASPSLPHQNTNSSTHHSSFSSGPTHSATQSACPHPGSKHQVGHVSGGRGKKVSMGGGGRGGWSMTGGRGRDNTIRMEIEVDKLRLQYETFPRDSTQSSRVVFLIRDLEIRDRLTQSNINKFLYQYATESIPRQSHTNMISLKVLTIKPELEVNPDEEEVSIRLSVLPIRLNIDQDSFYFLFEFFNQVSDTSSHYISQTATACTTDTPSQPLPPHITTNTSSSPLIFIRSFVFQPALPIKIDYTTKWRFPTDTMGTLPGILISLYHLDNSELTLKSLNCKTGFLGWDSLLECVTREWSTDIMSRQLPLILKGVGPTHYITQFVHGVVDLVRLPYHQYQEDGRIVWGLQQGASSFSTSTGVAVVELTSRTLETLQSVAQMVYDLVTPVPVEGHSGAVQSHQRKAPHQPQDFREGVSNAYDVVTAGLTGTAVDLYAVASQEHEERGVTGAVGGILRQIPGTVVKPVILLSEATRHVLGGVKNQFVPDARKEAKEKWKTID